MYHYQKIIISEKRKEQITSEAYKRLNIALEHSSFKQISEKGSYTSFKLSLCLSLNFTDKKFFWQEGFTSFVRDEETYSCKYDQILKDIFDKQMQKNSDLI